MRLDGKVALITGAARGIGFGIAELFAQKGAIVYLADVDDKQGKVACEELRGQGLIASYVRADMTDRESIDRLVDTVLAVHPAIDILVHNAGVFIFKGIGEIAEEEIDQTLYVYLKAAFFLTQRVVPTMRKRPNGRLLFTSSISGNRVVTPRLAHYAAAKAGMNAFIRTAALEYARDQITVNGVEPGWIRTKAWDGLASADELVALGGDVPVGRMGGPHDVAHAMLYLASEGAGYVTGQTIVVDGGLTLSESVAWTNNWYSAREREFSEDSRSKPQRL